MFVQIVGVEGKNDGCGGNFIGALSLPLSNERSATSLFGSEAAQHVYTLEGFI